MLGQSNVAASYRREAGGLSLESRPSPAHPGQLTPDFAKDTPKRVRSPNLGLMCKERLSGSGIYL